MSEEIKGLSCYDERRFGFFPLVICNSWRVAVLNYFDVVELQKLYRLERHPETDETFVLTRGKACLILGEDGDKPENLRTMPMVNGQVYNIKKNVWHHIVMTEDASVVIMENAGTGVENSQYEELSPADVQMLKDEIRL